MIAKRRDTKGRVLREGEVQRPDGKYMFRYSDSSGVRRTIYSWKLVETDATPAGKKNGPSLREQERQIQRDLDDRIRTVDAVNTSVDDLFEQYMDLRWDLKETTRNNYTLLYTKHVKDVLGSRKIGAVRSSDIKRLYTNMVKKDNLKISTVRGTHSILYQMFEIAVMDDVIRKNPTVNVMKMLKKTMGSEQDKRHALTEEEQERFISFVYASKDFARWAPLFTVLLGTGMRIGEALGLRWSDCDFKNNTISVNHALLYKPGDNGKYEYRISPPKTRAGVREIPMLDEVRDTLKSLYKRRPKTDFSVDGMKGFIFLNNTGKVFTPASVYDAMQRVRDAYNREEYYNAKQEKRDPVLLPKFSAHILRHTFCTRYCENEPNLKIVQEVMGHKSIRTTMDVYNEATELKKRESMSALQGKIKVAS